MSLFLSHLQQELRRTLHTRRGATLPPDQVPRGLHKSYPRMPQIKLPEPQKLATGLDEVLNSRISAETGDCQVPLSLQECGTLFGHALRKRPENAHRNYPSGGALYPIETYLFSTALENESPAAYHYEPAQHALERLWKLPEDFNMKSLARHPDTLPLSSLIVFTSVWQRSSAKYGDLAYQHALIEAGHMSENILLVGTALKLNLRPYAGFNDELIVELLNLNEDEEQSVHSITICKS